MRIVRTTPKELSDQIDAVRAEMDALDFDPHFRPLDAYHSEQGALFREDYTTYLHLHRGVTQWARQAAIRHARLRCDAGDFTDAVHYLLFAQAPEDMTVRERIIKHALTASDTSNQF